MTDFHHHHRYFQKQGICRTPYQRNILAPYSQMLIKMCNNHENDHNTRAIWSRVTACEYITSLWVFESVISIFSNHFIYSKNAFYTIYSRNEQPLTQNICSNLFIRLKTSLWLRKYLLHLRFWKKFANKQTNIFFIVELKNP